jgi:hypothetical protein
MNHIHHKTFVYVFCLILLTGFVAAEVSQEKQTAIKQELQARYTHLECKATLAKARANTVATYLTIPDINDKTAKLATDMDTLKGYADDGKIKEFNDLISKDIKEDLQDIQQAVVDVKPDLKNKSMANKQAIRDSWKGAVAAYATCNADEKRNIVTGRIAVMNAQVNDWNKVINNLKQKGLKTTELEKVVTDAAGLTTTLNAANDAISDDSFAAKVKEARDLHLHLWAQFHIAKINAYLDKVEPMANASNLSKKVTDIRDLLDKANQMATPGKQYGEGEFETTWEYIKEAGDKLKDLVSQLKELQGVDKEASSNE